MKDLHDDRTFDLIPSKAKRGRPKTHRALTAAEKQAAYRVRKAALTVTVTFNRADFNTLKHLVYRPDPLHNLDLETVERIREVVFQAS